MSEPLKPAEIVKFGSQLSKAWGWFKHLFKKNKAKIAIVFLAFTLMGCAVGRAIVRGINAIPIPNPPASDSIPNCSICCKSIGICSIEPPGRVCGENDTDCYHDPVDECNSCWIAIRKPTPTPAATATPTPNPTPTPVVGAPPILIKNKVGGHPQCTPSDPCTVNNNFGCHNPKEGPQFRKHNRCEVGMTQIYDYLAQELRGPKSGPCDTDHPITWFGPCVEQEWDICGGGLVEVTGAVSWEKADNPHHTIVTFTPGKAFEICIETPPNAKTCDGRTIHSLGRARACATHKY